MEGQSPKKKKKKPLKKKDREETGVPKGGKDNKESSAAACGQRLSPRPSVASACSRAAFARTHENWFCQCLYLFVRPGECVRGSVRPDG